MRFPMAVHALIPAVVLALLVLPATSHAVNSMWVENEVITADQLKLTPEYFENSENREIFNAYKEAPDVVSLKERTDPAIHEHIESINSKSIPATRNNIEPKFTDCVLELRKRFLKNLAARKAESGDGEDGSLSLEENMEICRQLKELDARRSQKHSSSYRTRGANNGR